MGSGEQPKVLFQAYAPTDELERLDLIDDCINYLNEHGLRTCLDQYDLYLVLDEAITNAMEHGNRWDTEKRVCLTIYNVDDSNIVLGVKDEGIGFNPVNLPKQLYHNGRLSPRGRGIFIIAKFCYVDWNRSGNEIFIRIPRSNNRKT